MNSEEQCKKNFEKTIDNSVEQNYIRIPSERNPPPPPEIETIDKEVDQDVKIY